MRKRAAGAAAALSFALAAGCGTIQGPKYESPDVPDKAQWSQLEGRELTASEVIRPDWWTEFGDPELNDLIKRAVDQGLDVKIAALRLDRAGIQLGKDRLALTPEMTVSPADSVTRQKNEVSTRRNGARHGDAGHGPQLGAGRLGKDTQEFAGGGRRLSRHRNGLARNVSDARFERRRTILSDTPRR